MIILNNVISVRTYEKNKVLNIGRLVKYKQLLCYIVLITSFMNATLRLTDSGMTAIYRLISPLIFMPICIKYFRQMEKNICFYILFLCYSLLVSVFYNNIDFSGYILMLYLLVEYILIKYLAIKEENFSASFFSFLDINIILIIVLGIVQYFFPFTMPHLPDRGHTITLYFWNENELSQAIACMAILYLYRFFFLKYRADGIKAACIFIIIYINDAKLSLLGLVLAFSIFVFYKMFSNFQNEVKISSWVIIILGIFLIIAGIISIFTLKIEFHFRDYTISLNELMWKGIKAIVTLQPMKGLGSEIVRANAIIFGLQELYHSYFLGIGWENSIFMLEKPQFFLGTAKSMHNIIIQFLCEMGYFAMFCYAKLIISGLKSVKYINLNRIYLLKITFGLSFILISSQSSSGILSNYLTWAIVIYVFFLNRVVPCRGSLKWNN